MITRQTLLLAVLALLPALAAAQTGERSYEELRLDDFGFAVARPSGGVVVEPDAPEWGNPREVAFEWYGDAADPVVLVQGRVDDLGQPIDAETFRIFSDALLSNWAPAPAEGAEAPAESPFEILGTADNLQINGRTWNLIEVADRSDNETTVYYSVFSTFEGTKIYTLTLYYLENNRDRVEAFGKPIMQGFKVL